MPILALPVQEYLEAVGIRTTIKEYLSSEYFRTVRTFELPGMFWFFTNTIAEPETVIGSGVTESGFYAVSVYPETEIEELYQAQNQAHDPGERARLLEEMYITFYDNYSWLFLTEVSAAAMLAAKRQLASRFRRASRRRNVVSDPEAQDLSRPHGRDELRAGFRTDCPAPLGAVKIQSGPNRAEHP